MEITPINQPVKLEIALSVDDIKTLRTVTHNLPNQYDFRVLVGVDSETSRKYLNLIEGLGIAVGGKSREHADPAVRRSRTF